MATLMVHTKTKKQTETVKAVLAALKVDVEEQSTAKLNQTIHTIAKDIQAAENGTLKTLSVSEFIAAMEAGK
jgi:hypothetical protein